MFRGREQTTIDKNGRLKVPFKVRAKLLEFFGPDVFMTILTPGKLMVFPLKVWEEKEMKLKNVPDTMPEKEQFLLCANVNGAERTIDDQGRLSIPAHIIKKLGLNGDAEVVGGIDKILVLRPDDAGKYEEDSSYPTPQALERLREYGV